MANGLTAAAQQIQSLGRGSDTMLAHVSPDEAKFIDYMQGGRQTNPMTGLPEYGMFGDILKAVARAAGAIGGFMVGGPAGAAAGSGIATKLTGGSWKDALGSAALSGIGSWGAQGLTGGGWDPTQGPGMAATNAGLGDMTGGLGDVANGINITPQGSLGSQFLAAAKSTPGIAAAIGAQMGQSPVQPKPGVLPPQDKINLNVVPQPRKYMPYPGDPLHFAEPVNGQQAPGMGYEFYSPLNPQPIYQARGGPVRRMAMGGPLAPAPMPMMGTPALAGPQLGMRGARMGGADMPGQPGSAIQSVPAGGIGGIGHNDQDIRKAAMLGYMGIPLGSGMGGMSRGGTVSGPGDGQSDDIPAQLSAGEHVVDAGTVSAMGNGSNAAGQRVMEQIKQHVRAQAGMKNPKVPMHVVSLGDAAIARAKRRAGVG